MIRRTLRGSVQPQLIFELLEIATTDRHPGAARGDNLRQLVIQQPDLEDGVGGDQILAVAAQQRALFFQRFEGELGVEQLALTGHMDPAQIGEGILHLRDREQPDPIVQIARNMFDSRGQPLDGLRGDILLEASEGLGEPGGLHRFEQVVEGVLFKCLNGIFVKGGDKDDAGQGVEHGDQLHAAQLGHLDIEEHHIRLEALNKRLRLDGVGRFPHDLDGGIAGQLLPQLFAGVVFVIDYQGADHGSSLGMVNDTRVHCSGSHAIVTP
ncbi:hypothetical protein AERO8C_140115 [Aeromonas veronii]|uniref:Uncharacterized protein n=1 Tax=Aeromonas veronii TaxID=654 RepID=A0A653KU75_AERVE|nr:hypothetical protein AERO8C_140115 [Aeromonas veronii]